MKKHWHLIAPAALGLALALLCTGCSRVKGQEALDALGKYTADLETDTGWFCLVNTTLSDGKNVGLSPSTRKVWYENNEKHKRWYLRNERLDQTGAVASLTTLCFDGKSCYQETIGKQGWQPVENGPATPFGIGVPYAEEMADLSNLRSAVWNGKRAVLKVDPEFYNRQRDRQLEKMRQLEAPDQRAQYQLDYMLLELENTAVKKAVITWDFEDPRLPVCQMVQKVEHPIIQAGDTGWELVRVETITQTHRYEFTYHLDAVKEFLEGVLPDGSTLDLFKKGKEEVMKQAAGG